MSQHLVVGIAKRQRRLIVERETEVPTVIDRLGNEIPDPNASPIKKIPIWGDIQPNRKQAEYQETPEGRSVVGDAIARIQAVYTVSIGDFLVDGDEQYEVKGIDKRGHRSGFNDWILKRVASSSATT